MQMQVMLVRRGVHEQDYYMLSRNLYNIQFTKPSSENAKGARRRFSLTYNLYLLLFTI